MNLRDRRMDAEWQMLETLAGANRAAFAAITRLPGEFRVVLQESPAWVGDINQRKIESEHTLRYIYPRYYPSLPLQGYFVRPILHVNVDPATGFVCLWQEYRPNQTIVDAIVTTRAIMACRVANLEPAHSMRRDIAMDDPGSWVLPMPAFTIPENCRSPLPHRRGGNRLTTIDDHNYESICALSDPE